MHGLSEKVCLSAGRKALPGVPKQQQKNIIASLIKTVLTFYALSVTDCERDAETVIAIAARHAALETPELGWELSDSR